MANKIPNRQAICDTLLNAAKTDKDIVVLCSDSRGSASLTKFADTYPEQFVEMGIAEQDLVRKQAGEAAKAFLPQLARPAATLTRSCSRAAMSRQRSTVPTPTPTSPSSAFPAASATARWA